MPFHFREVANNNTRHRGVDVRNIPLLCSLRRSLPRATTVGCSLRRVSRGRAWWLFTWRRCRRRSIQRYGDALRRSRNEAAAARRGWPCPPQNRPRPPSPSGRPWARTCRSRRHGSTPSPADPAPAPTPAGRGGQMVGRPVAGRRGGCPCGRLLELEMRRIEESPKGHLLLRRVILRHPHGHALPQLLLALRRGASHPGAARPAARVRVAALRHDVLGRRDEAPRRRRVAAQHVHLLRRPVHGVEALLCGTSVVSSSPPLQCAPRGGALCAASASTARCSRAAHTFAAAYLVGAGAQPSGGASPLPRRRAPPPTGRAACAAAAPRTRRGASPR